ncbi:hypothetical protein RW25_15750 [Bacillus sp. L_1B0_8]|uniref:hypothetical protein n=1 Tax=unclassified Bacillus (in: firmicutes) TaxID=185979 RepID=UPI0005B6EF02|nr:MULTISPECIES: hypothetical protein [unclassified Bacillus (in: firmicutes)]KIQ87403.1 hypothetical protein RW25_15750 [Bacillus sp. L_1B0_8]KIQ89374.1 hypothetical protein RT27_07265 [Bacillus sp. L_1B0_5]
MRHVKAIKKSKKYEYAFVISFISFFVLIFGTLIVGLYTEFKFLTYFIIVISINGYITNEFQKKYKNETKSVLS